MYNTYHQIARQRELNSKWLIIKKLVFISFFIFSSSIAFAQPISVPYFCGFEDAAENANWHFSTAGTSLNKWTVGSAEKAWGDSALYVSFDAGVTAGNNNTANYISVYRTVTLQAGQQYDISFDWKNPGYGKGKLYVCWVPDNISISPMADMNDGLPLWVRTYCNVNTTDSVELSGAVTWQNRTFSVATNGQTHKLVFVWVNTSESKHPSGMRFAAGCIDNVQIRKKNDCPRPINFRYRQVDASRGIFSWNGGAEKYELKYKGVNDENFINVIINDYEETINVRALKKGVYIAYIRSICETGDTSIWSVFPNILVHYSDNSCLDFVDLYAPQVKVWTGLYHGGNNMQWTMPGVIDYGYASWRSHHTVHYDVNDYDVRTNYKLCAVPPDGMPSVRVGTWHKKSEANTTGSGQGQSPEPGYADQVEYTYYVSADAPLLLMKYAVVLQFAMDNHPPEAQAQFVLNITDMAGNKLGGDIVCGQADFIVTEKRQGWKEGVTENIDPVGVTKFKEWTSIGLNLSHLVGQTIKISVSATGCAQSGHYGYAYFSMDCMAARVSGIGCGDKMFGQVQAPEGFKYVWYEKGLNCDSLLAANPNYSDTLQTFTPPLGKDDHGTYICRLISKEQADCAFELEARFDPRDVYADVTPELKLEDCKATVNFNNRSYTLTRYGQERGIVEEHYWDFGDGNFSSEPNPTHTYKSPITSKDTTYTVKYTAGISEGLCEDYKEYQIVVQKYGNTNDTVWAETCKDNPDFLFEGTHYNTTTTRTVRLKSMAGCDSLRTLCLSVLDTLIRTYSHSITSDTIYVFYGDTLFRTGTYNHRIVDTNGSCDSIIRVHFTVFPALHVSFDEASIGEICEDNTEFTLYYNVDNGALQKYDLIFSKKAIDDGFLDLASQTNINGKIWQQMPRQVRPNDYEATFIGYNALYSEDTLRLPVKIPIFYSDRIIRQKWNDVLALRNADNNGGYVFSAYEWWKNGERMIGENASYLYINNGELDFTAEYRARITRADDDFTTFTCAFVPTPHSEINVFPTLVNPEMFVTIVSSSNVRATFVDVLGNRFNTVTVPSDIETQIAAPAQTGFYFLEIENENEGRRSYKILVQ